MEITRRGILKLFGLAGAATLVNPNDAVASLFGVEKSEPGRSILGTHMILVPNNKAHDVALSLFPGFLRAYPRWNSEKDYGDHMVRSLPDPCRRGLIVEGIGELHEAADEITIQIPSSDNPYIGYYGAAEAARKTFAQRSLQMLQRVPEHYRQATKLVTVAHQPIYARPSWIPGKPSWDASDGLEVVCDCTTRVVWTETLDLKGFDVYSEFGEIPMETPDGIQMAILADVDRKILSQKGQEWEEYKSMKSRRGFFKGLISHS